MNKFDSLLNELYNCNHVFYVLVQYEIEKKLKELKCTHVRRTADCLTEAVRRINMFFLKEKDNADIFENSQLLNVFAGLGTQTAYKAVVENQLMRGKDVIPRVDNWYFITQKGFDIIKDFLFIEVSDNMFKVQVTDDKYSEITVQFK